MAAAFISADSDTTIVTRESRRPWLGAQVGWLGLRVGALSVCLHSSNEPGELSRWLWSRCRVSSISIIVAVIIIIIVSDDIQFFVVVTACDLRPLHGIGCETSGSWLDSSLCASPRRETNNRIIAKGRLSSMPNWVVNSSFCSLVNKWSRSLSGHGLSTTHYSTVWPYVGLLLNTYA